MNTIKKRGDDLYIINNGRKAIIPASSATIVQEAGTVRVYYRNTAFDFAPSNTEGSDAITVEELFEEIALLKRDVNQQNLRRWLDTNGDGTGSKNAIGDYLANPTELFIKPPTGQAYGISRMMMTISGNGLDVGRYGNNLDLVNGIGFGLYRGDNLIEDLLDGERIFKTGDWASHLYDLNYWSFGSGNDFVTARWTFLRDGQPLWLEGNKGDSLRLTFNDVFTGMTAHKFLVKGIIV